jgi:hypothetical protein
VVLRGKAAGVGGVVILPLRFVSKSSAPLEPEPMNGYVCCDPVGTLGIVVLFCASRTDTFVVIQWEHWASLSYSALPEKK